jgi:DNA polymerase I-like protein with 3'-5' exonuclease and polymerase domains
MYDYLVIDVETTTFAKGNPYSQQNRLCLVGVLDSKGKETIYDIEHSEHGYKHELESLQEQVSNTNTLVVFNGKFDLAWLRRYDIDYSHCNIFDCQLAYFILGGQKDSYPSLNGVCEHYGLEQKLDEVKQLWEQGIDTPAIPYQLLTQYLSQDLRLTDLVYKNLLKDMLSVQPATRKLVSLCMKDLLVLLEMEWNGLEVDFEGMQLESTKTVTQIENLRKELNDYFGDIPEYCRNYSSNDCLSAMLYGGTIVEPVRVVVGVYKEGTKKAGIERYRIDRVQHNLLRRVEPPKGSELKKEGFYATNEETLRNVKASKEVRQVIDKLLGMSKLEKLNGTYYQGLKELAIEKDWEPGVIHGQFNQCVARTGRLSSSSPNLQNFPPEVDHHIRSCYG